MSFFGAGIPLIHGSGTVGILFSLFVVGVAALNLVLDFVEQCATSSATGRSSRVAPTRRGSR